MARCYLCGATKDVRDSNRCPSCDRKYKRLWRAKNKNKVAAYNKKWFVKSGKKFEKPTPEKYSAHTILNNAVQTGKLKRPERCQICNTKSKVLGHHSDYSKPLEIAWVCSRCHAIIHGWVGD